MSRKGEKDDQARNERRINILIKEGRRKNGKGGKECKEIIITSNHHNHHHHNYNHNR
jgi:hypothetical protein